MKRSTNKFAKEILEKQEKYENYRKIAYKELRVIEEYFGKRKSNRKDILWDILIHLEAHQKELSYSGHRGVVLGVITSILVYIFNTGIMKELLENKINAHWIIEYTVIFVTSLIVSIFFIVMFFVATGHFFRDDKKIRKQIYINEFIIKFVKKEYDDLN